MSALCAISAARCSRNVYRTQIQILLHMLVLTCPNAMSTAKLAPQSSSPRKSSASSPRKRRRYEVEEEDPDPTLEDQLEFLMDKLAVWQLLDSLEVLDVDRHKNDWAQAFCVDVVEPLCVDFSLKPAYTHLIFI